MKRCKQFIVKASEGITFDILQGTSGESISCKKIMFDAEYGITLDLSYKENGELTVKALNIDKYSETYANPPIPKGFTHIYGEWKNGFVIESSSDCSQFVWIPVGILDPNGTLDGISFTEKFGRRNYMNNKFTKGNFHETFTNQLAMQLESVRKYGGFYISRYNISINKETGKPQSVKGVLPLVNINFYDAKNIATTIVNNESVQSHLTYGAEFDSVLEWFIESKARTQYEITNNSTNWGNYWNTKNSPRKVAETGSNEEWCTNNIYDFAGNVDEWTQESNKKSSCVIRGGYYYDIGMSYPVAYRGYCDPVNGCFDTGFRATLYIAPTTAKVS